MRFGFWAVAAAGLVACTPAATDVVGTDDTGDSGFADLPDAVEAILVQPERAVVPLGAEVHLSATGLTASRTANDLTAAVTWEVATPSVATVEDGLDREGIATSLAVGETKVVARLGDVLSPAVTLVVTDATIEALSVTPQFVQLAVDQRLRLGASARFSDGEVADVSGTVRWITKDPSVVVVDDGMLEGRGQGTTTVSARFGDVVATPIEVTVVRAARADVTIPNLYAAADGGDLHVAVTVENTGTTGASDFWVDVFVDPTDTPDTGDIGDAFRKVSWLAPGAKTVVELTLPGEAGASSVTAFADTNDDVAEADETDNLRTADVTTAPGAGKPDLVVYDVQTLADATDVYYRVEVANLSDVAAVGPFDVDLHVDAVDATGFPDAWQTVQQVNPWSIVVVEFLESAACDPCTSWIEVDSEGDVDEDDETNNVVGPLDIQAIDLGGDTGETADTAPWW